MMVGFKNIILALAPLVSLVTAVPAADIGPHLNYAPKSYIVQFKEDVNVAAQAQWARSVHARNLSKYRKRSSLESNDGVKTIFRQFKYVLFPEWICQITLTCILLAQPLRKLIACV